MSTHSHPPFSFPKDAAESIFQPVLKHEYPLTIMGKLNRLDKCGYHYAHATKLNRLDKRAYPPITEGSGGYFKLGGCPSLATMAQKNNNSQPYHPKDMLLCYFDMNVSSNIHMSTHSHPPSSFLRMLLSRSFNQC